MMEDLKTLLEGNYLELSSDTVDKYACDTLGRKGIDHFLVAQPTSKEMVRAVLLYCTQHKIAVVPRGGGTGRCAAALPDCLSVIMDLSLMNQVIHFDSFEKVLTVQAGITLATVRHWAEQNKLMFPLSLFTGDTCQIGGNIATNAGGIRTLHYGNMRYLVRGLEAIFPDGTLWSNLNSPIKNNTGYDFRHLLIGSEGTLAVVTAASLQLYTPASGTKIFFAIFSSLEAMMLVVTEVKKIFVSAFELFPPGILELFSMYGISIDCILPLKGELCCMIEGESAIEAVLRKNSVNFLCAMADSHEARGFWNLRLSVVELQLRMGDALKHDIAVPLSKIVLFLKSVQVPECCIFYPFGHMGDGNIHANVLIPKGVEVDKKKISRDIYDLVMQLGGTLSAEHGIGRTKREMFQAYYPEQIHLMRLVKSSLDPSGIMNPGVFFE